MSEIKGQLLGVVLVISVFAIVAGILTTAFRTSAEQVADQVASSSKFNAMNTIPGSLTVN